MDETLRAWINRLMVLFVLLLIYHVELSSQQEVTHVPICTALSGYDITNLTKPNYWQFDKAGGCVNDTGIFEQCTFFFTFCHPLSAIDKCKNASVCQLSIERPDDIFELGEYVYDPFEEKEVNGFFAKFGIGETVVNKYTNKTCNVSIVMEFDCDSTVPWISSGDTGIAPKPIAFSGISEDNCDYYVKFPYAGACYRIITTTAYDPPPAKICVPPAKGYDISVLVQPPYWGFKLKDGCSTVAGSTKSCTINVAFCKPFEGLGACNGSSACVLYPNQPQNTLVLGNYSGDPFISAEVNGFIAAYPSGGEIINPYTNKTCAISLELVFDCDPEATWYLEDKVEPGLAPDPIEVVPISADSCKMKIVVPYAGACIKLKPSNYHPGLSTGSILIIIFVIAVFIYVIIGFGYNSLVDKQSGLKALPHYEWWATTGDYIKEGFVFIYKKVTCQPTSESIYNSI